MSGLYTLQRVSMETQGVANKQICKVIIKVIFNDEFNCDFQVDLDKDLQGYFKVIFVFFKGKLIPFS